MSHSQLGLVGAAQRPAAPRVGAQRSRWVRKAHLDWPVITGAVLLAAWSIRRRPSPRRPVMRILRQPEDRVAKLSRQSAAAKPQPTGADLRLVFVWRRSGRCTRLLAAAGQRRARPTQGSRRDPPVTGARKCAGLRAAALAGAPAVSKPSTPRQPEVGDDARRLSRSTFDGWTSGRRWPPGAARQRPRDPQAIGGVRTERQRVERKSSRRSTA